MSLPYKSELIPRAKELRKLATPQENHLWYDFLRTYPVRFQRQKAIDGFIVDFYCHAAKLVIEIDGSQHYSEQGMAYDTERSQVLSRYNLTVLRFSNYEINTAFSAVCDQIHFTVEAALTSDQFPLPSPDGDAF
ncbi:MAG: endonuclease domain-containing protein [Clostridia bacterium]|nr:endonuclease domain-containing protein [Clostridia bacterium]